MTAKHGSAKPVFYDAPCGCRYRKAFDTADDFPYDWLLCPACRRRDAAELLRSEVGS